MICSTACQIGPCLFSMCAILCLACTHPSLSFVKCLTATVYYIRHQCSCFNDLSHQVCASRYRTYLFYGSSKVKEMCYQTHLTAVRKVFQDLGILSGKKTHAPRGSWTTVASTRLPMLLSTPQLPLQTVFYGKQQVYANVLAHLV